MDSTDLLDVGLSEEEKKIKKDMYDDYSGLYYDVYGSGSIVTLGIQPGLLSLYQLHGPIRVTGWLGDRPC